jgi:cell division protein FtsW
VIFLACWGCLLLLSGLEMRWIAMLGGAGLAGLVGVYMFYENGRQRINDFLGIGVQMDTGPDQTDLAFRTITHGGFTGVGPGGGQNKFRLPEAHTDYIFSVIGEEFGLLACIAIACVYLAIVVRVLLRLLDEEDVFTILAAAGLTTQFGLQAIINMGVNAQIFPSKGMTLPFISYGGSSMLALCIGVGLLLAFTRRNPFMGRHTVVKWSGR